MLIEGVWSFLNKLKVFFSSEWGLLILFICFLISWFVLLDYNNFGALKRLRYLWGWFGILYLVLAYFFIKFNKSSSQEYIDLSWNLITYNWGVLSTRSYYVILILFLVFICLFLVWLYFYLNKK